MTDFEKWLQDTESDDLKKKLDELTQSAETLGKIIPKSTPEERDEYMPEYNKALDYIDRIKIELSSRGVKPTSTAEKLFPTVTKLMKNHKDKQETKQNNQPTETTESKEQKSEKKQSTTSFLKPKEDPNSKIPEIPTNIETGKTDVLQATKDTIISAPVNELSESYIKKLSKDERKRDLELSYTSLMVIKEKLADSDIDKDLKEALTEKLGIIYTNINKLSLKSA